MKKSHFKNPVCSELWEILYFRVPIWGFFEEKKCLLKQMVSTCGGKKFGAWLGITEEKIRGWKEEGGKTVIFVYY